MYTEKIIIYHHPTIISFHPSEKLKKKSQVRFNVESQQQVQMYKRFTGYQKLHRKYILVPAENAANNVVVVLKHDNLESLCRVATLKVSLCIDLASLY